MYQTPTEDLVRSISPTSQWQGEGQDGSEAQRKNSSCPESHSKGRGGSKLSPTGFCIPDASSLLFVVGGPAADLMDGKM